MKAAWYQATTKHNKFSGTSAGSAMNYTAEPAWDIRSMVHVSVDSLSSGKGKSMFSSRWRSLLVPCGVVAISIASSGCGTTLYDTAAVTGKVMCGDKPATGAVLTFEPLDEPEKTGRPVGQPGRLSRGIVQTDGSFTMALDAAAGESPSNGALIGRHRVSIIMPTGEPRKWNDADNWLPAEEQTRIKAEMAAEPVHPKLPCGDAVTPAEVEVKAGGNEFEFTLQPGTAPSKPQALPKGGSD
jgi:hypothetical protein